MITIEPTDGFYDTWMFCDPTPPAIIGDGWQHLGGTDFQYTPGIDLSPALAFSGIIPGRNYLITGYIEVMNSIPTRSSIRLLLGEDTETLHYINAEDTGTSLVVIGEAGTANELFQLEAWTNISITQFIVRDLAFRLIPEDVTIEALVDEDMRFLLDIDNSLLVSETQGI